MFNAVDSDKSYVNIKQSFITSIDRFHPLALPDQVLNSTINRPIIISQETMNGGIEECRRFIDNSKIEVWRVRRRSWCFKSATSVPCTFIVFLGVATLSRSVISTRTIVAH